MLYLCVGERRLEQFFTINSTSVFEKMRILQLFLAKDPSMWEDDQSFKEAQNAINGLAVVNDRAERDVALIPDFNQKLTTKEEQLQFLLQVVSEHRRKFPDCKKQTLSAATEPVDKNN